MYKIFLMIMIFVSTAFSDINWAKDFNTALESAKKTNKPVLFIISKHSCRFCIKLNDTTLKDKRVIDMLNKDFIASRSYIDDNDFVPRELFTSGVPAIWFLLPNAKPMFQPLMGAIEVEDFLKALEIVKEEYKQNI